MSWLVVTLLLFISSLRPGQFLPSKIVTKVLDEVPLIDGHNDLPWTLYMKYQNHLKNFNFTEDIFSSKCPSATYCQTDLPKIRLGKLGGFFLSAFVTCNEPNPVQRTLEQIDVIHKLVEKYHDDMEFVDTSKGIFKAFRNGKVVSLIGIEGGHSINSSLGILRMMYKVGARYLTLTHNCDTPWAKSSTTESNENNHIGLTNSGKIVVKEMNRLGMIVDLAHVSHKTMLDALDVSVAPVMFSHSSSFSLYPHPRNVKDDVLLKLKKNGGIIMVNFYSGFIGENATINDVTKHIDYIVDLIGIEHVGIGADFDGAPILPQGLGDVSHYVDVFDHLVKKNPKKWTEEYLKKLAGENLVRVFQQVEKVKEEMRMKEPYDL